jgi:cytochrome c1
MKHIAALFLILLIFNSCQNNRVTNKTNETQNSKETVQNNVPQNKSLDKGYQLMKQYCFSCHFETPDPAKKDQMIAPPMSNVQEHYKSVYSDKDDFIKAVVSYVNKPDVSKSLMPGATRRFGTMPAMPIGNDHLHLIAETLFDYPFKSNINKEALKTADNPGTIEKAQLGQEDLNKIKNLITELQNTHPTSVDEYQALGKKVFNTAKVILLNKNYKDNTLKNMQVFFHGLEDDMHHLMSVKSMEEGQKYQQELLNKLKTYGNYFK